jgi:hypothetical protein
MAGIFVLKLLKHFGVQPMTEEEIRKRVETRNEQWEQFRKEHPKFPLAVYDVPQLLKRGIFQPKACPVADVPALKKYYAKKKAKAKLCFANCQEFLLSDGCPKEFVYFEGFVDSGIQNVLVHHAWLGVDGVFYDPTLKDSKHYFGISFTLKQVLKKVSTGEYGGILLLPNTI